MTPTLATTKLATGPSEALLLRLKRPLAAAFERAAHAEGRSRQEVLREAVVRYVREARTRT